MLRPEHKHYKNGTLWITYDRWSTEFATFTSTLSIRKNTETVCFAVPKHILFASTYLRLFGGRGCRMLLPYIPDALLLEHVDQYGPSWRLCEGDTDDTIRLVCGTGAWHMGRDGFSCSFMFKTKSQKLLALRAIVSILENAS